MNHCRNFVVFLFLAAPNLAMSQQEVGTIVVFKVLPDHAVIAADSKTTRLCGQKTIVGYDVCKILTFENHYVFAAAGYTGRIVPDDCESGRKLWNVRDITKDVYRDGSVPTTDAFAHKWGDKMLEILREDSKISPPRSRNRLIVSGLFIGASNGNLVGEMVHIMQGQHGVVEAHYEQVPYGDRPNTAGFGAVVAEFMANTSQRAKLWHSQIDKLSLDDQIIALAKLVKAEDTSGEVGGPIDSVRMTPFGVQWISHKPMCGPRAAEKPEGTPKQHH
jgi:hypothetical protein